VDLAPGSALPAPVPLAALKAHPAFAGSPLVSQGRLSVVPITPAQWKAVMKLSTS
jgi:predicted RNA-binding protein with PUA-like domain